MLKIKFNINEFTIIFWGELKENKCWKYISSQSSQFNLCLSVSAPLPFSFQPSLFFVSAFFLFSFSLPSSFLFLFSVGSAPFSSCSFLVQRPFFFFSPLFLFFFLFMRCPFFSPKTFLSPKHFSLQPKTFFSSAQNIFFSAQNISLLLLHVSLFE